MIFYVPGTAPSSPSAWLIGNLLGVGSIMTKDSVQYTSDGVKLNGWWVPKPGAPVFLWFHGNAGNISHRLENIKLLVEEVGVQVFIFDYREYGKSAGSISREGTFRDAAASLPIFDRHPASPRLPTYHPLRPFLGTALATDIALQGPSRALILESAFTNSQEMARLYAPFLPDWRPKVPYDNLGKIGKVPVPVLIIHGSHDEIIPVDMARRVFEAAPDPKELYIIPGAHHNDTYLMGGPEYVKRLRAFIDKTAPGFSSPQP